MTSEVGLSSIPSASTATQQSASGASSELGQDAFLKLLVTQIQNQNPLDPSDPSEFLGQLASFTSLEQMGQINDSIESLALLQATGISMQNIDLVGRTVVYKGDQAVVQDGEARFRLKTTVPAQRIEVDYMDGGQLKTMELSALPSGTHDIVIDDIAGTKAEIRDIRVYSNDELVDTNVEIFSVAKVDGVTFEGGSPMLMLGKSIRIAPAEVLEILE